ncbi:unnamed protein product [Brachionus calyciflorus]|uniref:Uncharacterized protein n=1 Tax=Brachionus calyciflorus TaxID=104777 RepID=A0A813VIC0_9BILA|nr:unnamed protein product [Brachionus calyciflorus]
MESIGIDDFNESIRNLQLDKALISKSQEGFTHLHFNGYYYRKNSLQNKKGIFNWRRVKTEKAALSRKIVNEIQDDENYSEEVIASCPSYSAERHIDGFKQFKPNIFDQLKLSKNAAITLIISSDFCKISSLLFRCLPMVYGLLRRKTEDMYCSFINAIKKEDEEVRNLLNLPHWLFFPANDVLH